MRINTNTNKLKPIGGPVEVDNVGLTSTEMEETLNQSFLDYAAFIAQRRALPDARDGMKYTARQILHAQLREKLDSKHPFKKAQKSVSAATAFSYVHGPSSCYEQIIRMGRPLVQRYLFEEVVGNGGTPCSANDYSAERYVEVRLSSLANVVFDYIKANGLAETDWCPTYDEEGLFPLVLPSVGFYNICNGSFGSIGVGMISSIPQFNLKEVNEQLIKLIGDPSAEVNLLPDFASSGILLNPETTKASLAKGEGKSCLLRGEIKKNYKEGWLEVVSLPYGVFTETLVKKLAETYQKGTDLFTDYKDLSKQKVRVRIYSDDLDKLEKWLYRNTVVQNHFTIKLTMLDKGKTPKIFTLKEAMLAHLEHSSNVYRRQWEFQLNELVLRQEILEGLIRAHSIIDDVIKTIKGSNNRPAAIDNLVNQFEFSRRVSEAIVDMKLHKLTNFDIAALHDELDENIFNQNRIREILSDKKLFNELLSNIYRQVAEAYGDDRRTKIYNGSEFETGNDGDIPKTDYWFNTTKDGYVASSSNEDEILDSRICYKVSLDEDFIIMSSTGRVFRRKATELKLGQNTWKEELALKGDEKVILCIKESIMPDKVRINDQTYHHSYLTTPASKRGKKFAAGTWNIDQVELIY